MVTTLAGVVHSNENERISDKRVVDSQPNQRTSKQIRKGNGASNLWAILASLVLLEARKLMPTKDVPAELATKLFGILVTYSVPTIEESGVSVWVLPSMGLTMS